MCFTCMVMYGYVRSDIQAENLNVVSMEISVELSCKTPSKFQVLCQLNMHEFYGYHIASSWWMIGQFEQTIHFCTWSWLSICWAQTCPDRGCDQLYISYPKLEAAVPLSEHLVWMSSQIGQLAGKKTHQPSCDFGGQVLAKIFV